MIFKCYKKLDNTSLAVAIFLLALLSFASMEATAKYLSVTYPVLQVVWARYIFHYLAFLIFYIFFFSMLKSEKIFITRSIKLHLARSCSLFLMTFCFFYSLSVLPIADATAIVFAAPIIIMALSPIFLKEKMDVYKWIAVFIGFLGMLIVVKPASIYDMIMDLSSSYNFKYLSAVFSAIFASFFFALYQMGSRALAVAGEKPITGVIYSGLIGALLTSICLLLNVFFSINLFDDIWSTPDIKGWTFLILAGFLGAVGQFLALVAYKYANATTLAPINYVHLIYAAVFSMIIFSDLPKLSTVFGSIIIIFSGLYAYKLSKRKVH